jgi:hypothetical protein
MDDRTCVEIEGRDNRVTTDALNPRPGQITVAAPGPLTIDHVCPKTLFCSATRL